MAHRPTPATATRNPVAARPPLARGRLVVTGDITCLSRARLFATRGKETPLWLRLPLAKPAGLLPAPLCLTFHTEDGPWDLPLRLLPVDFLRAPMRRLALDLASAEGEAALWEFCSLHPETLSALLHSFADAGRPASWRHAAFFGAGVHSLEQGGRQIWCRFQLQPLQGAAEPGEGLAPPALFDALQRGAAARWRLALQIMTEAEARDASFDAFDATLSWPSERWPWIEAGLVVLEGRVDLAPTEAAHAPRVVPGIGQGPRSPRRPATARPPQEAGALFRAMAEDARARLLDRMAAALRGLPDPLLRRVLGHVALAEPALGAGLARRLRFGPRLMTSV